MPYAQPSDVLARFRLLDDLVGALGPKRLYWEGFSTIATEQLG